jgi:hypothetical protein
MSMLGAALSVTGLAVALGLGLVSVAMIGRDDLSRRAVPVAHVHGAIGLMALAAVLVALRGPPRGTHSGAGSFGAVAAALLGGALLAGLTILAAHLRRRPVSALAIGLHASLGVAGFVILAAFYGAPPD